MSKIKYKNLRRIFNSNTSFIFYSQELEDRNIELSYTIRDLYPDFRKILYVNFKGSIPFKDKGYTHLEESTAFLSLKFNPFYFFTTSYDYTSKELSNHIQNTANFISSHMSCVTDSRNEMKLNKILKKIIKKFYENNQHGFYTYFNFKVDLKNLVSEFKNSKTILKKHIESLYIYFHNTKNQNILSNLIDFLTENDKQQQDILANELRENLEDIIIDHKTEKFKSLFNSLNFSNIEIELLNKFNDNLEENEFDQFLVKDEKSNNLLLTNNTILNYNIDSEFNHIRLEILKQIVIDFNNTNLQLNKKLIIFEGLNSETDISEIIKVSEIPISLIVDNPISLENIANIKTFIVHKQINSLHQDQFDKMCEMNPNIKTLWF